MKNRPILLIAILLATLASSCIKEEKYLTDPEARLSFSEDTVKFDTVFTTMATTTRQMKVYNHYDETLLIDAVSILHGTTSRFRINVDGDTGAVARNVEIAPHDSIFIFIQATINPNDRQAPFLITDSIVFTYNNRQQFLPLTAYGRNAVYHTPTHRIYSLYTNARGNLDTLWYPYSIIDCDNWDHTLPHVIFGYAVVNSNETLHLQAGDELYFGDKSYLWVYDSATIDVRGTQDRPVLFTSIRHDGWYDSLPGQWGYVWLSSGSKDNHIEWARIENGTVGIVVDTNVNPNPTLDISNSVVMNHSLSGIVGQGAYIVGDNLLVCNCGSTVLSLQYGGRYRFTNSTFANYWRYGSRKAPAVVLNNYYAYSDAAIFPRDMVEAYFYNCIIYGSQSTHNGASELMFDYLPTAELNCRLEHSIVHCAVIDSNGHSLDSGVPDVRVANLTLNQDPRFKNARMGDFHLLTESPAIGAGNDARLKVPYDLDGYPRAHPPSAGAFEWREEQ